jgi:hypothetical protein
MAGLVWDLLRPHHITKYDLRGLAEKLDCEYEIVPPNIGNEDHDSSSIFIDKETCLSDNSPTLYRRCKVVLAKRGTSRPMRFLKRLGVLLVFTLTLGLFCSEVPESLSLDDDTSNDFVTSTPAHSLENFQTVRQEASPRPGPARIAAFPGVLPAYSCEPPLSSGPELLRLLSIQRK